MAVELLGALIRVGTLLGLGALPLARVASLPGAYQEMAPSPVPDLPGRGFRPVSGGAGSEEPRERGPRVSSHPVDFDDLLRAMGCEG